MCEGREAFDLAATEDLFKGRGREEEGFGRPKELGLYGKGHGELMKGL